VLVAPKQRSAPPPTYPPGAHGDAVVILDVDVTPDGHVQAARVVEGEEPFASAARSGALAWSFDPATRDGAPIRATIRARVTFSEPATTSSPPPSDTSTAPAPAPSAPAPSSAAVPAAPTPPDAPIDLTVEGTRHEVAATPVGRAEIRLMPGSFGDPFRVVEAMPGVTPMLSGVPFFYVRGAAPGQNANYLDGIRVPLLFHVGAGPSVVSPALLERVDFFAGGAPASYGHAIGGVLGGIIAPPIAETHGEWCVRLFDASAMIESTIAGPAGRETTAMVAGRYGYPALALSIFSDRYSLAYWDYQLRVSRPIGDHTTLSALVFGAYDSLYDKRERRQIVGTQFHRADLRLDHATSHGHLRLSLGLGWDRTGVQGISFDFAAGDDAVIARGGRLRLDVSERVSSAVTLRAGAEAALDRYVLDQPDPDDRALAVMPPRTDGTYGTWIDAVLRPAPGVELVPGLRFDLYGAGATSERRFDLTSYGYVDVPVPSSRTPTLGPRFGARVAIAPGVTWISSFALAHQRPSFVVPTPGLQPRLGKGLQSAWQFAQGLEAKLPAQITATATAFHHVYGGLTDGLSSCSGSYLLCDLDRQGPRQRGRANGLELLVRRDLGARVGFWLAYTLSRSEVTTPATYPAFAAPWIASRFDRTHTLTAAGSVALGRGWRAGARGTWLSGRPIDPRLSNARTPGFVRLDLRVEKRWTWSTRRWVALTFEWFDATLSREPVPDGCDDDTKQCKYDRAVPISIPSIGVEGSY
jgi:TonB family protein